jgi:hypothetical protein
VIRATSWGWFGSIQQKPSLLLWEGAQANDPQPHCEMQDHNNLRIQVGAGLAKAKDNLLKKTENKVRHGLDVMMVNTKRQAQRD